MTTILTRQIPVSEQTVKRLKDLADPLDDTYDSVISRLLDAYGSQPPLPTPSGAEKEDVPPQPGILAQLRRHAERAGNSKILQLLDADEPAERIFDPFVPPNLTHTKITSAVFDGRVLSPASWNGLLDEAVRTARRKLRMYAEVRKICLMNIVDGKKTDEGYHFIPEVGVSV